MIEDLDNFSNNVKYIVRENFYQDEENARAKEGFFSRLFGRYKCGRGVCLFQNPDYAENNAGIIEIPGYKIKLILMCRVNPKKIREPKSFSSCWILNPTPDEIRPYRILIKKIPTSSLTGILNDKIITSPAPIDYIISIFKSKDYSFLKLIDERKYQKLAYINKHRVKPDHFVLRVYTYEYYREINRYLRDKDQFLKGKSFLNEKEVQSLICCIQKALKRNRNVKDNTIVYRGINVRFPNDIGVNSRFYFRDFISTSKNLNKALGFLGNFGTLMIIKIKNNGKNRANPNYCYYLEHITMVKGEEEVLISSQCHFIVEKFEKIKDKNKLASYFNMDIKDININHNIDIDIDIVTLICEGYILKKYENEKK